MLLILIILATAFGPYSNAETKPSTTFADLAERAKQARDANQPDVAAKLYAAALQQRPSWVEGWWDLGSIQYKLQDYGPAVVSFRHVTELNPRSGAAFSLMGLCNYELGQYSAALKNIDRGGKLGSGDDQQLAPLILYHAALLLTREGDFERSTDQLAMFVAAENHSPEIVVGLGLSTLRMPLVPTEIPAEKRELVMKAGEAAWQYNAHNVEDARKLYAELVAAYPQEPNVHYAYGEYLLESDPPLAFEEFKKELKINPSNVAARLQVAFFNLQQGEPEEAMKLARETLPTDPKDYRVHLVMGRAFLQMDQFPKAVQELKIATTLAADDSETHFYLAQAYRSSNNKADATREQAEFDRLKREDSRQTSINGWWYFAGQYYQKHRFAEARDALHKITAQNSKDSAAWAMMGLCDFELKDYPNALEHLTQANQIGLPPKSEVESALHYYLAILLNQAGKFDAGLKELAWFAGKDSVEPQITEAMGVNSLRLQLLPAQIPADKHDLVMQAGAAAWALNTGHLAEAKHFYEALIAAYPDVPNIHYEYGICLSRLNDADGSRREFLRELEITPTHADAQSQLAFGDLKQGDHEKALQEAETAVKLGPDSFLAHNALGWALMANQQFDRAIEEMTVATRLAPDAAATHYSLAQAYKAAGNTSGAEREMAKFESLTPGHKPEKTPAPQ